VDYETDCLVAAAQVVPVNCHVVEDLVWVEIDDERQLIRARDTVYPAILQREKSSGTAALLSEGTKNAQ
jgi:choline kinase